MTLIEEARSIVSSLKDKEENERRAKEFADREWEQRHAENMLLDMQGELRDVVLEAARLGQRTCSLAIYSWSSTGRPSWVNLFRGPFDNFLANEQFKFEFKELQKDVNVSHDPDRPYGDTGWYEIEW